MKSYSSVWIKRTGYGHYAIENLAKHQTRFLSDKTKEKDKLRNEERHWEFERYNLYLDNDFKFVDSKKAYEGFKNKYDKVMLEFKNDFEWTNFGHDRQSIKYVRKQIFEANPNLWNEYPNLAREISDCKELEKPKLNEEFGSLEYKLNLDLAKVILKNKTIKKEDKDKYEKAYQVWKLDQDYKDWKFDKNNELRILVANNSDKLKFEWDRGKFDKKDKKEWGDYLKEKTNDKYRHKFITEHQIHVSANWFAKIGWVDTVKNINFNKNGESYIVHSGIREITNKEALKDWFEKSVEWYKDELIKNFGSADKFLGAQLHLDEAKPHINFQFHNLEKRIDGRNGKERITPFQKQSERDIFFNEYMNEKILSFYQREFDRELVKAGTIKQLHNIDKWLGIDELKKTQEIEKEKDLNLSYQNFIEKDYSVNLKDKEFENNIAMQKTELEKEEARLMLRNLIKAVYQEKENEIDYLKDKLINKYHYSLNWVEEKIKEAKDNKRSYLKEKSKGR